MPILFQIAKLRKILKENIFIYVYNKKDDVAFKMGYN